LSDGYTNPHAGTPCNKSGPNKSCSHCYEHARKVLKQQHDADVRAHGSTKARETLANQEAYEASLRKSRSGSATCRTCGQPVEWSRWAKSGRPALLDVAPRELGKGERLLVLIAGSVRHYEPQDEQLHREKRTCHWEACKR